MLTRQPHRYTYYEFKLDVGAGYRLLAFSIYVVFHNQRVKNKVKDGPLQKAVI